MYDDTSYYTFIPSAQPEEEISRNTRHRRNTSLLDQPRVSPVMWVTPKLFLMLYVGECPS